MTNDQWIEQYKIIRPRYEHLGEKAASLIKTLLHQNNIKAEIEHRTKAIDSFSEKIARPGKNYQNPLEELTDLAGVRIILHSLSDVKRVSSILSEGFDVDEKNSLNKIEQLDPDRFGYLSLHYILKIGSNRAELPEWQETKGLYFETQVRTTLQHAWAVIQHTLDYKNNTDVPKNLRRRLYRVSALLELADEELDVFANEVNATRIEYKEQLSRVGNEVSIDVESLKIYVESSSEIKYWNEFLRTSSGQKVETWGDLSRDAKLCQYLGITTINEIENILNNARGWGEEFLKSYYKQFFSTYKVHPSDVTTVVNGTMTQLLMAANIEKFNEEILNKEFDYSVTFIIDVAKRARKIGT